MEYTRKYFFLVLLSVVLLNCVGCTGMADRVRMDQQRSFDAATASYDAIKGDMKKYLGVHKSELRASLGEPSQRISPSVWDEVKYDEEWVYTRGVMFINKQYRLFYIKNDVVAHVEFGGIFN